MIVGDDQWHLSNKQVGLYRDFQVEYLFERNLSPDVNMSCHFCLIFSSLHLLINFDFGQLKNKSSIASSQTNLAQKAFISNTKLVTSSKMVAATAFLTGLLAMTASTEAYRITYRPAFPSRALRRESPSSLARQSYFPRDIGRMMDDVDELLAWSVSDRFYDPFSFQRMSRPSYLLEGRPATAVVPKRPVNTYSITQDEKQVKMIVTVPGAKASDVKLDLDEDNRTLRISGETKLENEGVQVHSRFDKAFTLDRNLDIGGVTAEFDSGVLTITAPKLEEVKNSIRGIDIVDNSSSCDDVNEIADENEGDKIKDTNTEVKAEAEPVKENKEEVKSEADESVIDLDESKTS